MRMKKYLILALTAAIAAVGCSKTFEVVPSPTDTNPIGFGTWVEHLTKGRTQGSNTFASGDNFAVYGYKAMSDNSDPHTVFDDVTVSTTNGTTWTYTGTRFWDANYDKYIFYAVSPASVGTGGTVDPQTGAITSASITFAGNDNDILVADKKTVNKTDGSGNFNSWATVPLVFNHVASLVDFKVKKAPGLANATVTVSAFTLSEIDNAGVLTVSSAYTDTHPVVSWSTDTRASYGPGSGVTPVNIESPIPIEQDTAFDPANPTTPAGSTFLINNLIVKPQTFRASNGSNPQKVTMTYKIAVTGSADVEFADQVLYLADFDNVDDDAQDDSMIASWEPGKHYTFFITIDAHAISFSATITNWTAVNGYHYLVN